MVGRPLPPQKLAPYAEVKQASNIRLLTGENLFLVHGVLPLLESRAVDFMATDIQKCGGVGEAKRIADICDRYGVTMAPHNVAGPLGLMTAAHVCAATANFAALEFHGQDVPFWDDLILEGPIIENGRVRVSERPGIGVTLNEPVAREYAKPGESWFRE